MSLAGNYATLLREGTEPGKVLAYMKAKGHLTLLPQVARLIEREKEGAGDSVLVAKEKDAADAKRRFPGAKVVIDPRVVGGYLAKVGGTVVDATYRKALVSIYKHATK